jgi:hypothetical protein
VSRTGTGDEDPSFYDCFKGRICKYLKNRLAIKNNKNLHLWWSWLQGIKRGCAPATDDVVTNNLEDHAVALSKIGSLAACDNDHPAIKMLEAKCHIFWDRAINNHTPPAIRKTNRTPAIKASSQGEPLMTPTCGASWESPMKDGGTHNWLFDYFHFDIDRKNPPPLFEGDGPCPVSKNINKYLHRAFCKNEPLKIQGYFDSSYKQFNSELLAMWYDPKKGEIREERGFPLHESFEDLVELSRSGRFDHTNVEIIPLKEPLKIRTISKGNALKYWLAKPMQRMMRDLTRKYPQMALTGGPLEHSHIQWLWSETDSLCKRIAPYCPDIDLDFSHVVSGDYKGATDGIDIRATKMAFETILSMVDFGSSGLASFWDGTPLQYDRAETIEKWKNSLRDVLYEQTLHYPEGGPDPTLQSNGQLMGSNLSFPILCVINLIGYWTTLEEYTGLQFEPNQLPVLVNGDDILFRTPRPRPDNPNSFYELWKKNITTLGFELSVGKNYIHDRVFTVNSECWVISGAQEAAPMFRRIRHLDVGLLTNNNAAARLENRVLPLADRLEQVLEGAHDKNRAWRRLKHYYRKELKSWMQVGRHTTFNVFSAVPLGGLGVKTHGIDPCYTPFQRRFAGFMRKRNLAITNLNDLKSCEVIALTTEKEGFGLCYEIPKSRSVQWVKSEVLEEEADLQLTKDIRSLPVLSREQAVTRSSWVKKYTTRSLKLFQQALKNGVVHSDADPSSFDFVLALDPYRLEIEVDGGLLGPEL